MDSDFENEVEQFKFNNADLYLALQSTVVEVELAEKLGLQAFVECSGERAFASIKLNDGYSLIVSPAVPGYGGTDFWMSWKLAVHPVTKRQVKLSQFRCRVELVHADSEANITEVTSFGLDAANFGELVRLAIEKVQAICELTLVALPLPNQAQLRDAQQKD
jgi:hypothetical protein